jgi:hypothetical protein
MLTTGTYIAPCYICSMLPECQYIFSTPFPMNNMPKILFCILVYQCRWCKLIKERSVMFCFYISLVEIWRRYIIANNGDSGKGRTLGTIHKWPSFTSTQGMDSVLFQISGYNQYTKRMITAISVTWPLSVLLFNIFFFIYAFGDICTRMMNSGHVYFNYNLRDVTIVVPDKYLVHRSKCTHDVERVHFTYVV